MPGCVDAASITFDPQKPLIDNFETDYSGTLYFLSVAGLSEAFLFLRRYDELSDGQKYRFKLAKVLSQIAESREPKAESGGARGRCCIIADEFCSTLDRLTAKVIAYNVRKMATKFGVGFALATAHDDIIEDLQPDILVRKGAGARVKVERQKVVVRKISFAKHIRIREGTCADWEYFSQFHYKSHNLGAVDKIFVMTLSAAGAEEPIGIVVYAYPTTQNRLRNLVTGGRYCGGVTASARRRLLNCELRLVQRIVIDPRFRGLGFASELLRETAPAVRRVGVRFIECLAVMGAHSRFLENAGFVRVGMCVLPRSGRILLGTLKSLGLCAETLHSPEDLLRKLRPIAKKNRTLLQALVSWWSERSQVKGSPHRGRKITPELVLENLPYITRFLAKDITSRPYYFFLDTDKQKAEGKSEKA
jgi:GNAT superfamily N-acetyltransferase